MKKLIEALKVIKEECEKHDVCKECPFGSGDGFVCCVEDTTPDNWKINDKPTKALL